MGDTFFENLFTASLELPWYMLCRCLCLPGPCKLGRENLHIFYSTIFYESPMISFFGASNMGEGSTCI